MLYVISVKKDYILSYYFFRWRPGLWIKLSWLFLFVDKSYDAQVKIFVANTGYDAYQKSHSETLPNLTCSICDCF